MWLTVFPRSDPTLKDKPLYFEKLKQISPTGSDRTMLHISFF